MNYAECRFRDPLLLQHGFYKNISEENEQLKSDNECYVKRYSELFEDYIACKKENEQLKKTNQELNDELQETIGYLSLKSGVEKENEQLKSTIKEVIELLSEEVDLFTDKATEHDINAYIELKELDNKDAFYMAIATKKAIKMLKELQE